MKRVSVLAAALVLSACGGGGGDSTTVGTNTTTTTTSSAEGSWTGTIYSFVSQSSSTGAVSGTVSSKNTLVLNTQGITFNGTYDATDDQPALLTSVQGTYSGAAVGGATPAQSATVTVDASGNISSNYVNGSLFCNTTGTATPRASGKNIFNVQLTFTGNFCALASGTTTSGVATLTSNGTQLIAMTLKADKSDGLIFIGTKQ